VLHLQLSIMWMWISFLLIVVASGPGFALLCGSFPTLFRFIKSKPFLFRLYVPLCWYQSCMWRRLWDSPSISRARRHALYVDVNEAAKQGDNINSIGVVLPVESLPPLAAGSLRFVCISDTHTMHGYLRPPPGDVLLHGGDILLSSGSSTMGLGSAMSQYKEFRQWLGRQPHPAKVCIGGNHDRVLELIGKEEACRLLGPRVGCRVGDQDGCRYLCNEAVRCELTSGATPSLAVHLYGTPYSKLADHGSPNNAFQGMERGHFPTKYPTGPGTVLLSHGPPRRIVGKSKSDGCPHLAVALAEAPPAVLVCGHLHRSHGCYKQDGIVVVNASSVSGMLSPTNPPIVFDIAAR